MIFSKLDLAEKIKKYVDFEIVTKNSGDPKNKRDYIINFDKVAKLGFKPRVSIGEGIKELVKFYFLQC